MKKMTKFVSIALAMMLVLSMGSVAAAEGALKIGFIGPLTGAAAVYGTSAMQGGQIAVDEINALGGLQIEFLPQDDEHAPDKSVNAYEYLMDQNVQVIVGCVTSSPCVAVADYAYEDRVFMLTPSASSTAVTEGRDNVYQVCFSDPAQGAASAQYIGMNGLATKVAVIYNNADAYSTGIYQTFMAEAANQPFEVVSETTFTDDTTDFSVQVAAAKDAGAELIFLPIYYTPASMILKQAASMEYNCQFFGVDGMDGILTMEGFDTSLAEGVMLLTPFSADAEDERSANFVAAYQAAYNETPTQFAADTYDCIYIVYEAMQAAGLTADSSYEEVCEALIAFMPTYSYNGITGSPMTWNEKGEVSKTPMAVVIENGVYVGK
ncbi:MAG: amino acid ABC transporter substrate-binding protein [Clostridiales bacterium]|nr:amino acid ABC transporter substrate-binding protein [Clostridiales bacterium]